MIEKHCFAFRHGKCKVLTVKKCEGDKCPFFKTKAQADEDQKKAFRRIKVLDLSTKRNIISLYYGGKMSLLDDVEVRS